MSISQLTLKSSDEEPVRRFEVFTGSGRRRDWSDEQKAQIVAESYEREGLHGSAASRLDPAATVHLATACPQAAGSFT